MAHREGLQVDRVYDGGAAVSHIAGQIEAVSADGQAVGTCTRIVRHQT